MTSDGTVTASVAGSVATDAAGNANSASTSTDNSVLYDATAPTITGAQDPPAANANGWNNTDVVVSFTCADAAPRLRASTSTPWRGPPSRLGYESIGHQHGRLHRQRRKRGGRATVSGISIDKTAPNAPSGLRTPAVNGNGWNNTSPVQVGFAHNGDAGAVQSGIDLCTTASSVTGETAEATSWAHAPTKPATPAHRRP